MKYLITISIIILFITNYGCKSLEYGEFIPEAENTISILENRDYICRDDIYNDKRNISEDNALIFKKNDIIRIKIDLSRIVINREASGPLTKYFDKQKDNENIINIYARKINGRDVDVNPWRWNYFYDGYKYYRINSKGFGFNDFLQRNYNNTEYKIDISNIVKWLSDKYIHPLTPLPVIPKNLDKQRVIYPIDLVEYELYDKEKYTSYVVANARKRNLYTSHYGYMSIINYYISIMDVSKLNHLVKNGVTIKNDDINFNLFVIRSLSSSDIGFINRNKEFVRFMVINIPEIIGSGLFDFSRDSTGGRYFNYKYNEYVHTEQGSRFLTTHNIKFHGSDEDKINLLNMVISLGGKIKYLDDSKKRFKELVGQYCTACSDEKHYDKSKKRYYYYEVSIIENKSSNQVDYRKIYENTLQPIFIGYKKEVSIPAQSPYQVIERGKVKYYGGNQTMYRSIPIYRYRDNSIVSNKSRTSIHNTVSLCPKTYRLYRNLLSYYVE